MNTLILLFIGLFAASTIIVARVVISTRKRRRKANEEEQTHKAELEAREHKLKTLEERIAAQTRELEAREASLKRETEALIREREDVAAMRKKLNTDEEKIAAEQSTFEKKVQEHLTKERQLQDIAAELESKSKHLATFEESLKKTCEELEAKDLKLTALKEEIDGRASALMKEKERLDEHEAELKALQDKLKYEKEEMEHKIAEIIEDKKNLTEERSALKIAQDKLLQFESEIEVRLLNIKALEDNIAAQKQDLEVKEDALKKESDILDREREDVAAIQKELNIEAEKIAGTRAMLDSKSNHLEVLEESLKKTNKELEEKDLKLSALKEEIEVRADVLMKEKEELDARDAELKTLQDESKSERDKLEQWANELGEFHERLTSKEKSLYSHESKLKTLEDELSIKLKNAENESNELENRLVDVRTLQEKLVQHEEELEKLEKELKIREDELQKKGEVVKKLLTKFSGERADIENERRSLEEKSIEIAHRESALAEHEKALVSKEIDITKIEKSIELERAIIESKDKELKLFEKELDHRRAELDIKSPQTSLQENETKEKNIREEKKDILKQKNPYVKEVFTEEREKECRKPLEAEMKPPGAVDSKRRKEIDLGGVYRRKPGPAKYFQQVSPGEETTEIPKEKEITTRMESPFVEINLDDAKVFLVLPKQQFEASTTSNITQQLDYDLTINGEQKTFSTKIIKDDQGYETIEEKIELEKPLTSLQIVFPDELQGRTYSYNHNNKNLFVFVAIGNNRGRMHYLYEKDGYINPLPKKDVWILLNEDFELETEPDVVEERWIWENYKPLLINLKGMDEIIAKNIQANRKEKIPCETSFSIEGEQLVDDDFKDQIPLFVGRDIKIKAPKENQSGWIVWIQNKRAGYQIITESWSGTEVIELKLPDNLPCECGEFQVDICEQEERIPVETLFFRYITFLQLEYQKELMVPDAHDGHRPEIIKVILGNDLRYWELKSSIAQQIMQDGYVGFELPPEKDTLHFSIAKMGKPETEVRLQITIPRLKWRTSEKETWSDKPLQIKRDELISGTDLYLFFCTNDFDSKYVLLAILEANNQKLQEAEFIRKGMTYNLLLNQFYDTVKQNIEEATVSVELWKVKEKELLHKIRVLSFTPAILRCKLCDFKSCDRQEITSHIVESHLSGFTEPLTLEEMRKYDSSLPYKIYKCNYCPKYVREDDPANATSSITAHIEKLHKRYPIKLHVIDDIDEIRENMFPDLPYFSKCTLCGVHFTSQDKGEKIKHLLESHSEDLYYV